MTKRSRTVALFILGAAAFALAGCREEEIDAQAFPDAQSCKNAANATGAFSSSDCDTAFAAAQQLQAESAPRYDSLEVCEEQHGVGECGDEAQVTGASGGGSIFMPLLAGYLIGNMLARGAAPAAVQPLYKTPDGKFTNATGSSTYQTNSGQGKLAPSHFAKAPSTIGKAPMTKATVASRGGFGGAATGRTSTGG
ncbi:DUF1190 domain-containing protein [Paracoccaceae bacterium Fryx2]|nr:DUF1190 domain-containing protein [Paracoccaceae bacterium Fryx2]MDT8858375.1 DUF1190 domain-containing protein [Paracoccaceae bacterium Fryx2]